MIVEVSALRFKDVLGTRPRSPNPGIMGSWPSTVGSGKSGDIESGEFAVDADELKACHKLRKRIPDAPDLDGPGRQ